MHGSPDEYKTLLVALAMFVIAPLGAQPIASKIDAIIAASPTAQQAHWGIQVRNLETGRIVYERGARQLFVPASNLKLFTTAAALVRLGPEYRFRTRVISASDADADGVLRGDITLVGGGDPDLSPRVLPYDPKSKPGDALVVMDVLADQVAAKGVRRITGCVIGDDTKYVWEPFPEGWAEDDAVWDFGAPVSALSFNDSAFRCLIHPGRPGTPPRITLDPVLEHLIVHNRVRTVALGETKIHCERPPLSTELTISGTIRAGAAPHEEWLAVDDPALFAAHALRDALIRRGIGVDGDVTARHRAADEPALPARGRELAVRESAPLAQSLQVIQKVSQNLHAEMMLRELGAGSREPGLMQLRTFLDEAGIPRSAYRFEDGSGLSRLNLASPVAAAGLLAFMYRSPVRDTWIDLLPVGGLDGTLEKRFREDAQGRFVHAKTGSMTHVDALSGYLLPERGRHYAFSIMVNGYPGPSSEVRAIMDAILLAILEPGR
jgi:D-alanyl-D-alanine carboxypeptidase/D-alanyl-D-alanine-endopeptidase (penicillin-binding protein 4)